MNVVEGDFSTVEPNRAKLNCAVRRVGIYGHLSGGDNWQHSDIPTTHCDKVQVVNKPLYLEVKPQVSTHNMSVKSPHCTRKLCAHNHKDKVVPGSHKVICKP